jgi:hypothetical protein
MEIKQKRDPHQSALCAYGFLLECGRSYIRKTLAMQLLELWFNLKESLLENSKLAQYACEEGHRLSYDELKVTGGVGNTKDSIFLCGFPILSFKFYIHIFF